MLAGVSPGGSQWRAHGDAINLPKHCSVERELNPGRDESHELFKRTLGECGYHRLDVVVTIKRIRTDDNDFFERHIREQTYNVERAHACTRLTEVSLL